MIFMYFNVLSIILVYSARIHSSEEKKASVTLEAESVCDHVNGLFFGVK